MSRQTDPLGCRAVGPELRVQRALAFCATNLRVSTLGSLGMLFITLATLAAHPATALPTDRTQAIEITAARAVRDEKAGYTVYSGDVVLEQGSLHIEADRLTVYHNREAADRIIAIGTPATLRQQPEINKAEVTASAGRIVYEKSRERVLLRQAASIEQEGAVVSGESIEYFMAEQRVRADASSDEAARVQVIIPAAVIEANSDEAPEGGPAAEAAGTMNADDEDETPATTDATPVDGAVSSSDDQDDEAANGNAGGA